tara:strand:- start:1348 stop:2175 length:828 start_codon:yes stop_codon:yes gene_type:complete
MENFDLKKYISEGRLFENEKPKDSDYGIKSRYKYKPQYIEGVKKILKYLTPQGRNYFLNQLKKQKAQYLCQGVEGECNIGNTDIAKEEIKQMLSNIGDIMTTDPIDIGIDWKSVTSKGDVENNRKALKTWLDIASKVYNELNDTTFLKALFQDLKAQQMNLFKFVAPILYKSKTYSDKGKYYTGKGSGPGYTKEHIIPSSYVSDLLFKMVIDNTVQEDFDILMSKYFQVKLNVEDDNKLDKEFRSTMPSGWDFKTDDPWDRYIAGGVDLDTIEKI